MQNTNGEPQCFTLAKREEHHPVPNKSYDSFFETYNRASWLANFMLLYGIFHVGTSHSGQIPASLFNSFFS